MATLTIPDLPPEVMEGLKARSIRNGRSIEAEALELITGALGPTRKQRLSFDELQRLVDEIYGPNKPKNVVDEFIAERRREAGREYGKE
jgi:plasmid stability protein